MEKVTVSFIQSVFPHHFAERNDACVFLQGLSREASPSCLDACWLMIAAPVFPYISSQVAWQWSNGIQLRRNSLGNQSLSQK